jgi:2-polyprenyl-6-methoxyphenol hydroxylase-like FAD-dependent oxidoreductase
MGTLGERAIVIGGSLAGLMTARVLADHFDQVTILERDHVEDQPALRKSIPQGSHAHVLLLGGQQVMSRLYPGFLDKLMSLGGGLRVRLGSEFGILTPAGKAYSFGGAVTEARDLGISFYYQSRGLLEHCVRQCTQESANVSFENDCLVQRQSIARGGCAVCSAAAMLTSSR